MRMQEEKKAASTMRNRKEITIDSTEWSTVRYGKMLRDFDLKLTQRERTSERERGNECVHS